MKRLVALFLAMTLFFSGAGEVLAAGASDTNPNGSVRAQAAMQLNGYVTSEGIKLSSEKAAAENNFATSDKFSQVYNHDWDKYSTNFYYNQLSDDEKELWDALDEICVYYLEEDADITWTEYDQSYNRYTLLDIVNIDFYMTADELKEFWQLFMLSNPQYYFLLNSYFSRSEYGVAKGLALCAYNSFADGDDREAATKQVKKQITKWENIIEDYDTDEEKVKVIHDLVCEKVTYNYGVFGGGEGDWLTHDEEQTWYTQSAYSVFCMDTTVCAGYSDAMAVMCNGAGIDAVSVTSYNHQWNKVRVDDTWYNYDTTWADSYDYPLVYDWYAKSDATYRWDGYSHYEEDYLYGLSPEANKDVIDFIYPTASKKVATPKISVTSSNGKNKIKITCDTSNATIYYTTDGKNPGVGSAKCEIYKGSFTVKEGATVKAIAICEGYKDSKIASSKGNSDAKSIKKATVKLAKTKYYYDGEVKKPKVTVKLSGKTLKANKDYKLTYKNNKNIGTATVTVTGIGDYAGTVKKTFKIVAATGETFTSGNNKYEVTGSSTVAFTGIKKIKKTVTVPSTVKFGGATFKVTKIADNALKNKTKVEGVTVGANVKEIGKQAFIGCKNLKTITIKSTKITKVGKNALKGINAKAKIKVPAKKLKDYKKLFKNKGQGKKVTIVKSK